MEMERLLVSSFFFLISFGSDAFSGKHRNRNEVETSLEKEMY